MVPDSGTLSNIFLINSDLQLMYPYCYVFFYYCVMCSFVSLSNLIVMCVFVLCILSHCVVCVLLVCKCVLDYCHRDIGALFDYPN
jgi:hypothetical protein